ncbi:hypothetical protein ABZW18_14140 [Streptomyces sp. NPDC004647]|uniref:hypothetical protein n=1 Tax=Streptomyces sp. NPDC004647 TaxID=3154671 RepID=UPI0033B564B9
MQPSAGSVSSPPPHSASLSASRQVCPHTRSRPVHWLVTATALAAVVGASALVQPSDATATPPLATADAPGSAAPGPAESVPQGGPDAGKATYPLDCGPESTEVVRERSADLDGDGRQETVAVVRCKTGFGTPPSGIYVLAHPPSGKGRPQVVETFLDPKEGLSISDFTVRGRTVSATLLGYSSEDVPRCCPDKQRKVKWQWREGKFRLTALPVAGSV